MIAQTEQPSLTKILAVHNLEFWTQKAESRRQESEGSRRRLETKRQGAKVCLLFS